MAGYKITKKDEYYTYEAPLHNECKLCRLHDPQDVDGGQITVQGPLIVASANQIEGANLITCLNAFVYGDECTNLIQPLYMIPALAMVGMKLKDVWGFMAFMCIFWIGMVIAGMLILPIFF